MFTTEPDLIVLPKPDLWALRSPLVWEGDGLSFIVPAGFVTDLASIPRVLRNILDVDGNSRAPAIGHDWWYCCQSIPRARADEFLRQALIDYGETQLSAWAYYAGVRIGGWRPWDARLKRGGGLQPDDFVPPEAYKAALAAMDLAIHSQL